VTALVEWPVTVTGSFDGSFLEVPAEALVATMKGNQKYFPVVDAQGRLLPHFITVANIESKDPAAVVAGNERVITPRLADADFFWKQDQARSLAERVGDLKNVVFQQRLGTLRDKSRRVSQLAEHIANRLGAHPDLAHRAAEIAKCDLLTEMVGEFPELQGVMGRYYALHDGEPGEVAQALDEQYMPRFAGDAPPQTATGQILSVADKLDSLVGIFGIGRVPTGDKDPFGLRRAGLGVLRILIERRLDLDLLELLDMAARLHDQFDVSEVASQVFDFMMDRLRAYYADAGATPDTFDAVLARRPTRPLDFDERVRAVGEFRKLPEAESLASSHKRIHNILKKAPPAGARRLDPALLTEPAEQALADAVSSLRETVEPMLELGEYSRALPRLAGLRQVVDAFFDQVLVMAEDPRVRDNRLALLQGLSELFLRTADISRLRLEGPPA
jgi:glycyl-tRNA synthetase beta chain